MNLIKKKVKENSKWKGFAKKAFTATLASAITVTSLFGFTGCIDEEKYAITEPQTDTSKEDLSAIVGSLTEIVSQLGSDNEDVKSRLAAIEEQLAAMENEGSTDKVLEEILAVIEELKAEVDSIKERLDAIENNTEDVPSEEDITKEEIITISNELAKANSKLAIEKAFNNNYMKATYEEGIEVITAPNGDVVATRNQFNDYAYYNKEKGIGFTTDEGEEVFGYISKDEQIEHFDFKTAIIKDLEKNSLVLDSAQSTETKYVFKSLDNSTLIINLELGQLISCENSDYVISNSSEEEYKELLAQCKSTLKSVTLFEDFLNSIDCSTNYQYKHIEATSTENEGIINGEGVYSDYTAALKTDNTEYMGDVSDKIYMLQTETQAIMGEEFKDGTSAITDTTMLDKPLNLNKSLKDFFAHEFIKNGYNTIVKNEETGAVKIINYSDSSPTEFVFKFNEGQSLEISINFISTNSKWVYKIEKIEKTKFDAMFNEISSAIEEIKQQEKGLTN